MNDREPYDSDHPTFTDAFGDEPQIALSDVAKSLNRNLLVLRRWTRTDPPRFRFWREPVYPHKIYVPLSEVAVIGALPRGSGNVPKPWRTRAANLARRGAITFLTPEQQHEALDLVPNSQTTNQDGSITVKELEHPSFTDD